MTHLEGWLLELGSKAGRKELNEQRQELRRGWYVGGKSFAESLREGLQNAVQGRRCESHGKAAAERRLDRALEILGLDCKPLLQLPKVSPRNWSRSVWRSQ